MSEIAERQIALLESIDIKLGALITLVLDAHLRETGIAKPKDRGIDRLLSDAGLSPQQIAGLLGKTDRAVRLQLEKERR
jgi:hypothetical protein